MIKTLIKSADLLSLPLGLATVMGGGASAALMGNFEIVQFSLCLVFVIFFQITANLFHRYADSMNNNGEVVERYIRYFREKEEYPSRTILREGLNAMSLLTLMAGMALITMGGPIVLIPGALLMTTVYFNSAGPRPLSATPCNYLITFLFFGPFGVFVTCYLQAVHQAVDGLQWHDIGPALFMGIIVGLMAGNSILMYNYKSYENDMHHGKHTLVTVIGLKKTQIFFIAAGALMFITSLAATLVFNVGFMLWPIIVCAIPFIINTIIGVNLHKQSTEMGSLWMMQRYYNWMVLAMTVLLFIIFSFYGEADMRDIQFF